MFTGLLAPAAAVAGMDWRGALAAIPVVLAAAWCWCGLGKWVGGWVGAKWKLPTFIYIMWGILLSGAVLASAAERVTAPAGRGVEWVALLLAVPVFCLVKGKAAVFGRTAEIFYLAMIAVLAFVLVFGGAQIRFGRLLEPTGEFWSALLAAAGIGCSGVAAVLLWDGDGGMDRPKWMRWSGGEAVALLLMSVVTVGVLSPALAAQQERPFFVMTVGLGQTARVEGLVSAAWLLSEVTLCGLLLQCGRKLWGAMGFGWKRGAPWVLTVAAAGAALCFLKSGESVRWLCRILPVGGLVLGGVLPAVYSLWARWRKTEKRGAYLGERKGKKSRYWGQKEK